MMKKFLLVYLFIIFSVVNSNAQSSTKVGLNLGGAFTSGQFSDVYKSGFSAELVVLQNISIKSLDLSFTVGYNRMKYDPDYFINEVKTNLGVSAIFYDPDWTATAIPVMLGARYKFPVQGFTPYLSGELGFQITKFYKRFAGNAAIQGSYSNPNLFSTLGVDEDKTESGFGASFGLGAEIPISKKVAVDLGFKYNYGGVVYSNSYALFKNNTLAYVSDELKNTTYLSLRLGIVYGF